MLAVSEVMTIRGKVAVGLLALFAGVSCTASTDREAPPAAGSTPGTSPPSAISGRDESLAVPGQVVVLWRGGVEATAQFVEDQEQRLPMKRLKRIPVLGLHLYQLDQDIEIDTFIRTLKALDSVERVGRNWKYRPQKVPDDPYYAGILGVKGDMQRWIFDGLDADRNLDAHAAWDVVTGSRQVVVGVVDSGIDLDSPDLVENLWLATEHPQGTDTEEDCRVGAHGWDFEDGDADPNPEFGGEPGDECVSSPGEHSAHGTEVASCIGARGHNGMGVTGAAWSCSLMALKVLGDDCDADAFTVADAISWGALRGADVLNISLEFVGLEQDSFDDVAMEVAISYAVHEQGTLIVAGAGNSGSTLAPMPASHPDVLSVGATDSGKWKTGSGDLDGRAWFSNYGPDAVDVVAPGHHLYGISVHSKGGPRVTGYPKKAILSGTSYSAPLVSGLAVLIIQRARENGADPSPQELMKLLRESALDLPEDSNDKPLKGPDWDGHGRVSFRSAIEMVDEVFPP